MLNNLNILKSALKSKLVVFKYNHKANFNLRRMNFVTDVIKNYEICFSFSDKCERPFRKLLSNSVLCTEFKYATVRYNSRHDTFVEKCKTLFD